jgi:hypothetical protein
MFQPSHDFQLSYNTRSTLERRRTLISEGSPPSPAMMTPRGRSSSSPWHYGYAMWLSVWPKVEKWGQGGVGDGTILLMPF